MNLKKAFWAMVKMFVVSAGFSHPLTANKLFVVTTESAQESALNWFGFLDSKEIPYQVVTPEIFNDYKKEPYIVVMGDIEYSEGLKKIARQALSAGEFKSLGEKMSESFVHILHRHRLAAIRGNVFD